ncbi:MAG: GatB/YqeY domain-containing protein [Bacteroidales bacterium]|nr:GatB/YqeY domain-containing protein [Bacteroidales bacterium]
MKLEERINADIKSAMLAKEKEKLEALRAIKSAVLLLKTDKNFTGEIAEKDEIATLQRLVKQRKEAALMYKEQNREDLYNDEIFQVGIIEKYLPEQMSEDDIRLSLEKIIKETGASSAKDMGKVMGAAQKEFAGKADNKIVSQIVKELLS